MLIRPKSRLTNAAFIGLSLAVCAAVKADLVFQGNGDPAVTPFYESVANQGYQLQDSTGFGIGNGVIYQDNSVPLSQTTVDVHENHNGADVTAFGTTIPGGYFTAKNYVSTTINNLQSTDGYYTIAAQGSRTTVEFKSPDAVVAGSQYTWHVGGSETHPIGAATSRLDFLAGQFHDKDFNYLFNNGGISHTNFGPGTYTYTYNAQMDVPIDLFFWTSAYAEIDRGVAVTGTSATLIADYFNTYDLESIVLLDTNNNPITNWTMEDLTSGQTVWNQDGRVPEPTSLAIIAMAIGAASRRNRR